MMLEVQGLRTHFFPRTGVVKAVDDVSFSVQSGETLGIVGESGSGKSTLALSIMRLVPEPGRIVSGRILLDGEDLLRKTPNEMQRVRGTGVCMILQDPLSSLNPVLTIGDQMLETLRRHGGTTRALRSRAIDWLHRVRIGSPELGLRKYPHEMSGGMRQRVVGAIAFSGAPKVLIADEPTTSLDATIQQQYLILLKDIQAQTGMSIIFVTHDFGIVATMCDRVAVMYAGKIVELANVRDLFNQPSHPYTEALLKSVPDIDVDVESLYSITGQPPALDDLPVGCSFSPRCPYVFSRCLDRPPLLDAPGTHHTAACWRLDSPLTVSHST